MITKNATIVTTLTVAHRMLDDDIEKDENIEIFVEFLSWLGCKIFLAPVSYNEFEKRTRKFGDETNKRLFALIKDGSEFIGYSTFYTEHHDVLYLSCYLNGVSRKNVSLVLSEAENETINDEKNPTLKEVVEKFLSISSPSKFEFEVIVVESIVKLAKENAEFMKHFSNLQRD